MTEIKLLYSSDFFDLIDNLLDQFLNTQTARCFGEEFGKNINSNAKDYFSITIDHKELRNNITTLGVLLDDLKFNKSRNGCTYAIFIDTAKIDGPLFRPFLVILLAHQICHFAFYYELFIKHENNTGNTMHKNFISDVTSNKYIEDKQEIIYQNLIDVHSIPDLLKDMGEISKVHFTRSLDSIIDYERFFYDFIEHMNISNEIKNKI